MTITATVNATGAYRSDDFDGFPMFTRDGKRLVFCSNRFNERPNDFVAFPAPAGPTGRGFMPVIAGVAMKIAITNSHWLMVTRSLRLRK